jgi:hypothetical protein
MYKNKKLNNTYLNFLTHQYLICNTQSIFGIMFEAKCSMLLFYEILGSHIGTSFFQLEIELVIYIKKQNLKICSLHFTDFH